MGDESPGGFPEQLVVGDHRETDEDTGSEANIEVVDVDVVYGAPALAISGFKSKGFIFSEIVRGQWQEGQTLSEGVFDTARAPQCEFSNLQNLPITFYSELLVGRSENSVTLVMPRALKLADDFVRLLCLRVQMFWGTICSSGYLRDLSDWRVGIRIWSCLCHFGGWCPEKGL